MKSEYPNRYGFMICGHLLICYLLSFASGHFALAVYDRDSSRSGQFVIDRLGQDCLSLEMRLLKLEGRN